MNKKMLKKNQVIIYVTALMLVVAGYLNFTTSNDMDSIIQESSSEEELLKMANIGDAQLVSSNVFSEDTLDENDTSKLSKNEQIDNTVLSNDDKNENSVIETNSSIAKNDVDYFKTSKL